MRHLLHIALILTAGLLGTARADEPAKVEAPKKLDAKVPDDFVEHKADNSKVSIKSPPTWTEKALTGNLILNLISDDGKSNVNIVKVGASPVKDPKAITTEVVDAVKGQFANFVLKSNDYVEVAGVGSPRLSYEGDVQGIHLRFEQTIILDANSTYIVTLTAIPERYDGYQKTVEQMLVSLKINE